MKPESWQWRAIPREVSVLNSGSRYDASVGQCASLGYKTTTAADDLLKGRSSALLFRTLIPVETTRWSSRNGRSYSPIPLVTAALKHFVYSYWYSVLYTLLPQQQLRETGWSLSIAGVDSWRDLFLVSNCYFQLRSWLKIWLITVKPSYVLIWGFTKRLVLAL